MMTLHRTAAIVLRQAYLYRGSFSRILPVFAWVAIDMILWGFITRYLNSVVPGKTNFIPTLLGAILLWDFFTRVMHGVTTAFLEDVWSRNFLNFFATPLSTSEYIGGLIVTSIITSIVGLLVMLVIAGAVFGLSFAVYGVMFIPFLLVLFLFGIALGVVGVTIVLRFGPASEWFIWPMPGLIAPFAAVFYPVSTLPEWMQAIAMVLPPSFVFEGMRAIVTDGRLSGTALAGGTVLAVLYVVGAAWLFRRVYRHAVRTGLIARYSAETAV